MSAIIKEVKISYSYQRKDGTMAHNLCAVESFRGHTASGKYFVGAYIHTNTDTVSDESGAFHLFEVCSLGNMFQVAKIKYRDYTASTLVDLENTCRAYTDSTFTLDEVADDLSIFLEYLENGC